MQPPTQIPPQPPAGVPLQGSLPQESVIPAPISVELPKDLVLLNEETPQEMLRPNWKAFIGNIFAFSIFFFAGILFLLATTLVSSDLKMIFLLLGLGALVLAVLGVITPLIQYHGYRYYLTDRRIIQRFDFWVHNESTIYYERVQNVKVAQGIIQRLFDTGDVSVETAAGGASPEENIRWVLHPRELRGRLMHLIEGHRGGDASLGEPVVNQKPSSGGQEGGANANPEILDEILTELRTIRYLTEGGAASAPSEQILEPISSVESNPIEEGIALPPSSSIIQESTETEMVSNSTEEQEKIVQPSQNNESEVEHVGAPVEILVEGEESDMATQSHGLDTQVEESVDVIFTEPSEQMEVPLANTPPEQEITESPPTYPDPPPASPEQEITESSPTYPDPPPASPEQEITESESSPTYPDPPLPFDQPPSPVPPPSLDPSPPPPSLDPSPPSLDSPPPSLDSPPPSPDPPSSPPLTPMPSLPPLPQFSPKEE